MMEPRNRVYRAGYVFLAVILLLFGLLLAAEYQHRLAQPGNAGQQTEFQPVQLSVSPPLMRMTATELEQIGVSASNWKYLRSPRYLTWCDNGAGEFVPLDSTISPGVREDNKNCVLNTDAINPELN